jgi:outer membrane lipopolysaccharide assembly protein LptE/RlpB
MPRSLRTILLLALLSFIAGCGYGSGARHDRDDENGYQWRSLYREDIQSVAVPVFRSTSFQRGVEFSLSKALVNQLEANTPYKVIPRERADTILEGEVVETEVNNLSNDRNAAMPQEQMMVLTVNFIWKDLRNGKILVERRGFEQTATYYPTLGEGRFVASQQAVEKLALAIVQELQADW